MIGESLPSIYLSVTFFCRQAMPIPAKSAHSQKISFFLRNQGHGGSEAKVNRGGPAPKNIA